MCRVRVRVGWERVIDAEKMVSMTALYIDANLGGR